MDNLPTVSETQARFDIAIVGGGPAGLSAGVWSARYGHSVVVIDRGDPRNWESRGINGYLGLPQVLPSELRARGRDECRSYGVVLLDEQVLNASIDGDDEIRLELGTGRTLVASRLLIAVGIRDVWPTVPGLEQVYGANAHVCPDCDGHEASGLRVVVIGSGKRAVSMALALTTWTEHITICTHGEAPEINESELCEKLDACNISIVTERIVELGRNGEHINSVTLANGARIETDKIFFTLAQHPADDLGVQLGCERDSGEHILVSEHGATSVSGVFAAGDITPGPQLAVRAACAGAIAAMAMHRSLLPEHRTLATSPRS